MTDEIKIERNPFLLLPEGKNENAQVGTDGITQLLPNKNMEET